MPPPPQSSPEAPARAQSRPQPVAGTRTDVLQWFEDAFEDLRQELHAVVSTVTRQQAMLAELLDSRDAEMRVALVAESLPELAGEAAAKALADQTAGLAELVEARLEDFRVAAESSNLSSVGAMDGMRELLQRIEMTAEIEIQAVGAESAAHLEALKASMSRQLKPIAAAVSDVGARLDEAEEREAARNRALRASVTKQIQPLALALAAAIDRSDTQMAEIRTRLDTMAAPAKAPPPVKPARSTKAAPAPAPSPVRPVKPTKTVGAQVPSPVKRRRSVPTVAGAEAVSKPGAIRRRPTP